MQAINNMENRDVIKISDDCIYSEQPHHQKEHIEKQ